MSKEVSSNSVSWVNVPLFNHPTIKITRRDALELLAAAILIAIGSLWAAGVLTPGGVGVLLPGCSFGAGIEGGVCLAFGTITASVIFARIFSPRFRSYIAFEKV